MPRRGNAHTAVPVRDDVRPDASMRYVGKEALGGAPPGKND